MLMLTLVMQVGSILGSAMERGGREGAVNVLKGGAGGGALEGEMEAMLSCIREVRACYTLYNTHKL
jgi:hypothetical protein